MNSDDIFFLFILCVIIVVPYGLFIGIPYSESKREANNVIKFSSFLAFYQVNPNKWKLEEEFVIYRYKITYDGYYSDFMCPIYPSYNEYRFRFNLIDFVRYSIWKASKDRKARQNVREQAYKIQLAQDVREYEEFIECIKQDLERFKQSKPWEDIK